MHGKTINAKACSDSEWNTKIHMAAADARTTVAFALSPGNAYDAPKGGSLLEELGPMPEGLPMLMDKKKQPTETSCDPPVTSAGNGTIYRKP